MASASRRSTSKRAALSTAVCSEMQQACTTSLACMLSSMSSSVRPHFYNVAVNNEYSRVQSCLLHSSAGLPRWGSCMALLERGAAAAASGTCGPAAVGATGLHCPAPLCCSQCQRARHLRAAQRCSSWWAAACRPFCAGKPCKLNTNVGPLQHSVLMLLPGRSLINCCNGLQPAMLTKQQRLHACGAVMTSTEQ